MKQTFSQRRAKDRNFAKELEDVKEELIFHAFGLAPDALLGAYSEGKIDRAKIGLSGGVMVKKNAPEANKKNERPNPVADLSGKEAHDKIAALATAGDFEGLVAVRDKDERKSIAATAHEALFTLRTT